MLSLPEGGVMIASEEIAIAKRLPKGARKCLMALTRAPTYPGRETFNANAAHNLSWRCRNYGGLAQRCIIDGRVAYYISPLGERIRDRIAQTPPSSGTQSPPPDNTDV